MKKITILLLLAAFKIYAINAETFSTILEDSTPIDLLGDMSKSGTRSLVSESPISVFQYSDYLKVTMSRFLGVISIEIYDNANHVVYNETVDTSTQSDLNIYTVSFGTGEYEIRFTNAQRQYLYGTLVIE